MLYTYEYSGVVVCHVLHDEYSGVCHVVHYEYSGCRVSCVMLYTTNIMMVVCYAVDDECSGGRVSTCTRRVQ